MCFRPLQTEKDFEELTLDYLKSAHDQGIVHSEIFVGFQLHMDRGIEFPTVLNGIKAAMEKAELYKQVHDAGILATAHAGEAFGPEYVQEAIEKLKVHRIDHGVRSIEDRETIKLLAETRIPLTVCPLSNICLKVYKDFNHHPFKQLMDSGVVVTVNSDDPAYFGGNINDNYDAVIDAYRLRIEDVYQLGRNSINASRLPKEKKESLLKDLDRIYHESRIRIRSRL